MTSGELAALVCSHLKKHDIDVVLTGGSCVSIYAENRYLSYDLDFIERLAAGKRKLTQSLAKIGFVPKGRYYRHPETEYFLEFPTGPLAVGSEVPQEIALLHFTTGELSALSPTDCIKDRLAAFFHWNDRQCFEQALLVANYQQDRVDL